MTQRVPIVLDDIVFSLQRMGGVSVLWGSLIEALLKDGSFDLTILERPDALGNEVRRGIDVPEGTVVPDKSLPRRVAQFSTAASPVEGALFHSSCYRTTRTRDCVNITTVHDFIWEYYTTGLNRRIHMDQIRNAVKASQALICVSESTRRDLNNLVPESRDIPTTVIHNGFDNRAYRYIPRERKPQVAFIGGRGGYKNFACAVDSVKLCEDVTLVVMGGPLSQEERGMLESKIPGRYVSLVYPSSAEVCEVYQESLALLYLSEYEGFGIPLLEGMAAGVPVIATSRSSIPEVAGDAGILLDDNSAPEVARQVRRLSRDQPFLEDRVRAGLERASHFSWGRCAKETLAYYRQTWDQVQ